MLEQTYLKNALGQMLAEFSEHRVAQLEEVIIGRTPKSLVTSVYRSKTGAAWPASIESAS